MRPVRAGDNLFASLIAAAGAAPAPRGDASWGGFGYAISNLLVVVKSKAASGFVPNFAAGGTKSQDRTEPPVGAKVMLELFKKFGETWPIEVVFDDLLDWQNWFLKNRVLAPAGLIALGSFNAEQPLQPSGGTQSCDRAINSFQSPRCSRAPNM